MSNIPIFVDEEIIRKFISEVKKLNFSDLRIEEIIEITKTTKYKDFANSYKINSLRKPINTFFRVNDRLKKDIDSFLAKTDIKKFRYEQ